MCGYRDVEGRSIQGLEGDGGFRTGDLGVIEDDGLVRVVGRCKEIIIRAGVNIVPETIDAVLRTHSAVADCKTVGIPDDSLGERVVTACVPAPRLPAHPGRTPPVPRQSPLEGVASRRDHPRPAVAAHGRWKDRPRRVEEPGLW